jgi:hypothetical protein
MMPSGLRVVVAAVVVAAARADFLNDYLVDKTWGASPGPCPAYETRCQLNVRDLPPEVQNSQVCVLSDGSGCGRFGDVVQSGLLEMWQLRCSRAGLDDATLTRQSTSATLITSQFVFKNARLACSMMVNIIDLVINVPNQYRVQTTMYNAATSFPQAPATFSTANLVFNAELRPAASQSFASELPWEARVPPDQCSISASLGVRLVPAQISKLTLCADASKSGIPFVSGFMCVDALGKDNSPIVNWIVNRFDKQKIVDTMVKVAEASFARMACSSISQQLIIVSVSGTESDGPMNAKLKALKAQLDAWGASPARSYEAADADDALLALPGVTAARVAASKVWSNDTFAEVVVTLLNNWLGSATSKGELAVNELVRLALGSGSSRLTVTSADLPGGVSLSTLQELQVLNVAASIDSFALDPVDRLTVFEALRNAVGGSTTGQRLRYSVRNTLALKQLALLFTVKAQVKRGGWVTAGAAEPAFTFTGSVTLSNLLVELDALLLFDFAQVAELRVGRIKADPLRNALPCLAPGIYALNVSDLGVRVDAVANASVVNFSGSGLTALLNAGVMLGLDSLSGGMRAKLPGIARGPVRDALNAQLAALRAATCPPFAGVWNDESVSTVDLGSSTMATLFSIFARSVGGDPVVDTAVDVNNALDTVARYFAASYPRTFPLLVGAAPGQWVYPSTNLGLVAFPDRSRSVTTGRLVLDNVDSVYRLIPEQSAAGVKLTAAIGAPLRGQPAAPRPLRLSLPISVVDPVSGVNEAFTAVLELSQVTAVGALQTLKLNSGFQDALALRQLWDTGCSLRGLNQIAFDRAATSLSIGKVAAYFNRTASKSTQQGNAVQAAIGQLSALPQLVAPGGRFETLVNTALRNGLLSAVATTESLPARFEYLRADSCSGAVVDLPVLYGLSSPSYNATAALETCWAPLPVLPPVGVAENAVGVPSNASAVALDTNPLVKFLAFLFRGGQGLGQTAQLLRELASLVSFVEVTPSGRLDLVFPLKTLGLSYASDTLVPGLVADAGTLRIPGADQLLQYITLFQPIGKWTTRYALQLKQGDRPLSVIIESFVELNRAAVDAGYVGTEKVRETVRFGANLTELTVTVDLVSALDADKIGGRALGHFFTADPTESQSYHLAPWAAACAGSVFFPKGLALRQLSVQVGQVSNVSVASTSGNQLVSVELEVLLRSVAILLIDFYKDSLSLLCGNCLMARVNAFLGAATSLATTSKCPEVAAIPTPKFRSAQDHLFRFNTSVDWANLQKLVALAQRDFTQFNAFFQGALEGTYLPDSPVQFQQVPLIYYGQSYGKADVGISNVVVSGLAVDKLTILEPVKAGTPDQARYGRDWGYTTASDIALHGPIGLSFDVVLNAYDLFPAQPVLRNRMRVSVKMDSFELSSFLTAKVNISDSLQLQFKYFQTLQGLACVLIPFRELQPDRFNVTTGTLSITVQCLDTCDLPVIGQFGDVFQLQSGNPQELADRINGFITELVAYFNRIGAQQLFDQTLSTVDQTCQQLGADLLALLEAAPSSGDGAGAVTKNIAMGVGAWCLLTVAGLVALVPLHSSLKRRVVLQNAYAAKQAAKLDPKAPKPDMAALLRDTEDDLASPFAHRATPYCAKVFLLALIAVNVAITALAVALSALVSVAVQFDIMGATTRDVELVPVSISSLILSLWNDVNPFVSVVFAFAAVAVPLGNNLALLTLWVAPGTVLGWGSRKTMVLWVLRAAKIPFSVLFVVLGVMSSVVTSFTLAADSGSFSVLQSGSTLLGFNLLFRAKTAVILLILGAASTITTGTIVLHYLDDCMRFNRRTKFPLRGTPETTVLKAHRRIAQHVFVGGGHVRAAATHFIVGGAAVGVVLLALGATLPVIAFKTRGLAGLAEGQDEKGFSVIGLGQAATKYNGNASTGERVGIFLLELVLYMTTLVVPVAQMSLIAICFTGRFGLKAIRALLNLHRALLAWTCALLVAAALPFIAVLASPLARTYANFVSGYLVADLCNRAESYLAFTVTDKADAFCLDVDAHLLLPAAFLLLGVALQLVVGFVFQTVADQAVADRKFAAYAKVSGDARLTYPTDCLSRAVLRLCTTVKLPTVRRVSFAMRYARTEDVEAARAIHERFGKATPEFLRAAQGYLPNEAPARKAPSPSDASPAGLARKASEVSLTSASASASSSPSARTPHRRAPAPPGASPSLSAGVGARATLPPPEPFALGGSRLHAASSVAEVSISGAAPPRPQRQPVKLEPPTAAEPSCWDACCGVQTDPLEYPPRRGSESRNPAFGNKGPVGALEELERKASITSMRNDSFASAGEDPHTDGSSPASARDRAATKLAELGSSFMLNATAAKDSAAEHMEDLMAYGSDSTLMTAVANAYSSCMDTCCKTSESFIVYDGQARDDVQV